MSLLFVYGTLKSNQHNHRYLRGEFVRHARTTPHYRLVCCGAFPGLRYGDKSIVGELWDVPEEHVSMLDLFEGSIYRRENITLDDNTVAEAYILCIGDGFAEYEGDNWDGKHYYSCGEGSEGS